MPFKPVSSFEILCQPIAPSIPSVPYIQQGFFIQVTNVGGAPVTPTIEYLTTPLFQASKTSQFGPPFGPQPTTINLFTDFIDDTGKANAYPVAQFLPPGITGFRAAALPGPINPGATFLFGVQYLLNTANATFTASAGPTPQDSLEARGYARIDAPVGSKLLVLPTIRQVFNNYSASGAVLDYSESAYVPPLINGPELNF